VREQDLQVLRASQLLPELVAPRQPQLAEAELPELKALVAGLTAQEPGLELSSSLPLAGPCMPARLPS